MSPAAAPDVYHRVVVVKFGSAPDQPSARRDVNQAAHHTIQVVIDRTEPAPRPKNLAAVALGKLGGLKGGKARAAKLTPEQRREIAKKGARAIGETARAEG